MNSMKRLELLAPAKDWATAVAAIDCGADAVYMGASQFGARHEAGNSDEEFARAAEYAHRFGARIYCTLNTVLFDHELAAAEQLARRMIDAGADALIVQDMAYRRMNLPVELHASTQMCNTTAEGVRFLADCGFSRVVLERALSIGEIRAIGRATEVELECFIHGAICVSHSGHCFLARSLDPARSGNRGTCSQPCRLPWDLVDDSGRRLIASKHLLSPRDFNLTARLGEMIDAGVCSFKIEGRLKETNYVRNIVAWYNRALDDAIASRPGFVRASEGRSRPDFTPDPQKSFTRGETVYYIDGKRRGVASFDTPKSVGEPLGRVTAVDRSSFRMDRAADLAAGDGLCFRSAAGLVGTNVNAVDGVRITPNRMAGIVVGAEVFRNSDRRFNLALERSRTRRTIAVRACCTADETGVRVTFADGYGNTADCTVGQPLEAAADNDKMRRTAEQQLAKSGGTIFEVEAVGLDLGGRFIPSSLLATLRRGGLEALDRVRNARPRGSNPLPEKPVPSPRKQLTATDNVTNRLARAFWRDHGVETIEAGFDAGTSTAGRRVMECSYCIRREIGACLREGSALRGELSLVRGARRYRLEFDCRACRMYLVDS